MTPYIYPAGYKTSRVYTSPVNPEEKVVCYSEILDDDSELPLFMVTATGDEMIVFTGTTPTALWAYEIRELVIRFDSKEKTVSGPDAFLLSSPVAIVLIEHLPGASECHRYQMET
jgi:chromodomain-helicase-DNA-binding protein 7